jgi:hypothetical protein
METDSEINLDAPHLTSINATSGKERSELLRRRRTAILACRAGLAASDDLG